MPNLAHPNFYTDRYFLNDNKFDELYPYRIQQLAMRHWTPIDVAKTAARFLTQEPEVKILDIGSGVGKFCLTAAHFSTHALFFGIEQRRGLVQIANKAKDILQTHNARFIQGNFTQVNFKNYDHFYFYNSFGENLTSESKIDDSIAYSAELYRFYSNYLRNSLDTMSVGTRFVSYCSVDDEVPTSYSLEKTEFRGKLKFWIKTL